MQPSALLIRFIPVRVAGLDQLKGAWEQMDQIIRCLIRAAIESFPIHEKKRAEMLHRIRKGKQCGGKHNVP